MDGEKQVNASSELAVIPMRTTEAQQLGDLEPAVSAPAAALAVGAFAAGCALAGGSNKPRY
ncbi:hypothetical protein OG905_01280 [Streptomyces sp. NBC_00322]|uniref:hypothetical protein n=1 Tax=Streptomyces sp. NBC_00322 TaxID=2975712 RepID=UPI002E2E761E|nr:hypothetical protein [Streptomyces sp. NBC_00322]